MYITWYSKPLMSCSLKYIKWEVSLYSNLLFTYNVKCACEAYRLHVQLFGTHEWVAFAKIHGSHPTATHSSDLALYRRMFTRIKKSRMLWEWEGFISYKCPEKVQRLLNSMQRTDVGKTETSV